jgi:hypothetical protein
MGDVAHLDTAAGVASAACPESYVGCPQPSRREPARCAEDSVNNTRAGSARYTSRRYSEQEHEHEQEKESRRDPVNDTRAGSARYNDGGRRLGGSLALQIRTRRSASLQRFWDRL